MREVIRQRRHAPHLFTVGTYRRRGVIRQRGKVIFLTREAINLSGEAIILTRGATILTRGAAIEPRGRAIVSRDPTILARGLAILLHGVKIVLRKAAIVPRDPAIVLREATIPALDRIFERLEPTHWGGISTKRAGRGDLFSAESESYPLANGKANNPGTAWLQPGPTVTHRIAPRTSGNPFPPVSIEWRIDARLEPGSTAIKLRAVSGKKVGHPDGASSD